MSRPSDRSRIRLVQRSSLVIAIAGLTWAALLIITGGFNATFAGIRITAHEPLRPLLVASLALTVFILAGGDTSTFVGMLARIFRACHRAVMALWRFAPGPDVAAWILAGAMVFVSLFWGTKAVGGSDSWGYMSEAHGFLNGSVKIVQPFVKDVPWPFRTWSFTPLAYKPLSDYHEVSGDEEWTIVPFYSAGLPLLMAAAHKIAGYQAMFFIVPLLSGALVIATYGIGRRISSPAAALLGAWLTATSPCIMFMMMSTMTDVPVAGAFAVAFWLMLEKGPFSALGAGLAAAVAIAIRPNFVPIAAIIGLYYAAKVFDARTRREGFLHGALFSLGALPGPLVVAAVNNQLYGSPLMSGYGPLTQFFELDHILPNLQRYPAWLAEAQTHVAWIGLAAVFIPIRWIWPRASRLALVVGALTVLFVWGMYLVYDVYDAWWFSRFILTSWPFIMLGTASVAVAIARIRPKVLTPIVAVVMIAVSVYQLRFAVERNTFNLWAGERRFVVAAKMARRLTPRNSLIISGQHTGSLRFYAGRMTMHWDPLPAEWVDDAIDWLDKRGVHTYLMLEDWEVPDVRKRFEGQRAAEVLARSPMAMYYDPGTLYLYDLTEPHATDTKTEIVTGAYPGFWAAEPAPSLRFGFKP